MSEPPHGRPPEYFDALYEANPDPWGFETSAYEREKYDATLAALPQPRFAAALEVGCSIGVFTQRLAARCDRLLAVDVSATALGVARARCIGLGHVAFAQRRVPAEWPEGRYALIVLSEVLYFLDADAIARTAACVRASLLPGGCVMLVNWLGETDTALSGEAAADLFLVSFGQPSTITTERSPGYRLDCVLA